MSGEHRNQAAPPSSGDMKSPLLPLQEAISSQQTESSRFHFRIRSLLTLNYLFIVLGPLLSLLISLFVRFDGAPASSQKMLAVIVWVFTWWLTEAMPLPVTSMSPLFLFPLFGIASADRVAQSYMSDVITLILGSFILAFAVERYNVHRRLALNVGIIFCGDPVNPPLLLFGITAMSFFVSMWMHNVAATVMMMPIANGIIRRFPPWQEQSETLNKFCRAVVLAVVYGTAIGGTSTLTGTGVNLILAGMWKSLVPQGTPINFNTWFFFGFPFAALLGLSFWCLLCFFYVRRGLGKTLSTYFDRAHLKTDLQHMGPMAFAEKMVLIAFGVLILLWMTRRITDDIPGWGVVFHDLVGDGTVSVLVATLLFIIPNMKQEGEKLMEWEECKKLPWNLVLLLGAGFALADGVESSGLADVLSRALGFLQNAPYLLIVPMVSLLSSLITELITSNDATATLVVPLFFQMARTMHVHPLLLMVPGAISTEFAYWLPTSAPSNVVGFSSGHIEVKDMLKIGLPLKFIGIAILSLLLPTLGAAVFGVNDGTQWFTSHKDRLSP